MADEFTIEESDDAEAGFYLMFRWVKRRARRKRKDEESGEAGD